MAETSVAEKSVRVYADTSVFGGAFEPEFEGASGRFFDNVRNGRFRLVLSAIVEDEIIGAPGAVRALFAEIYNMAEVIEPDDQAFVLQKAYVKRGIVGEKWGADALHVALATLAGCSLVVSWNFKHIVHLQRIMLYNEINALMGLQPIAICSPLEVMEYGEEDV